MQLDLHAIHSKYHPRRPFRGCVHVGAFVGCERDLYGRYGIRPVAWFEAEPETFQRLRENVRWYGGHTAHNILLGDVDLLEGTSFNVTVKEGKGPGNNGSSSCLALKKHAQHHPNITVDKQIVLPMRRFDSFVEETGFDISPYNFLNVDVQGAELHVMRGMGRHLDRFDYIVAEVNEAELYAGCALRPELEAFLRDRGFEMREKYVNDLEYGDALFVRKEIPA